VLLVSALAALPIVALFAIALSGTTESFAHLVNTVLPGSIATTVLLLIGVGIFTASIGTFSAWLVSFFEFPGRRLFAWILMLPLAVPTYIASYAFVEFFSYTGPIQNTVRYFGGFTLSGDYWFPDIRSLPGAIFVLSAVLFPYVYISVRAVFHLQSARLIETARVMGIGQFPILMKILLPLARPAVVLGVTLALMETINDIGAIEYMGIETLTFSIFSVWLNQNDMAAAAQIALLLLAIALFLIFMERWARREKSFVEGRSTSQKISYSRIHLTGAKGWVAVFLCAMPVLIGFGVPLLVLLDYAYAYFPAGLNGDLLEAFATSISLALAASAVTVLLGLVLTVAIRNTGSPMIEMLVRFSSVGYAIPGTIVALGIFLPIAMFDNYLDGLSRLWFGIPTGLLITGSGATIIYAYVFRFMAMSEGALDTGFKKLTPQLDAAARSMGRSPTATLIEVLLPLMKPAIATAALLVFIDSLKELSATIMLRPFGVNTLSTHIYDFASQARVEEAGIACLIIVAAGIVPAILITKTTLGSR